MAGQNSPINQVAPSLVVNKHTAHTTKPKVAITIDHLDKNTFEYLEKLGNDMPHITICVYKRDIDNGFASKAKALNPQHIHLGIHPQNPKEVEDIYNGIKNINKSNEEITLAYHGEKANKYGQPAIKTAIDTLNSNLEKERKPPITHIRTTTVETASITNVEKNNFKKTVLINTASDDNIVVIDYNATKENIENLIDRNPDMTHTIFFHISQINNNTGIKYVFDSIKNGTYISVPFGGDGNYNYKIKPEIKIKKQTSSISIENDTFSTSSDKMDISLQNSFLETPEKDMIASVSPVFDKWLEENISSQYDNTNDNDIDIDMDLS